MVTNGGYGAVQRALATGVPLVVAGDTEDKPEVAARVAWSGAGIDLRTGAPTAKAVRHAVREVLGDGRYQPLAAAPATATLVIDGGLWVEKKMNPATDSVLVRMTSCWVARVIAT